MIIFLSLLLSLSGQAQSSERWKAFWDSNLKLKGFKDSNGVVKIEPKYSDIIANYFEDIMAVTENRNGKYQSYYLTKTGKIVGRDSLHYYDNGTDCESEGFIRFRDKKTGLVGMFDKHGHIVIPAVYNSLSKVQNGLVWALKGASKKYLDEHKEHYSYEGGEKMLINTKNEVILRNTYHQAFLNLYSLEIHSKVTTAPNRQSFESDNGKYYSFIDYEKEFKGWLDTELLNSLEPENLRKASHDSITFWQEPNGWKAEAKASFINRNFKVIRARLLALKEEKADFFFSIDGLNHYIFTGPSFDKYYNNCGEALQEKYPTMNLIINTKLKGDLSQDHFEFLRTENGYKLISISIRDANLK